MFSTTSEKPGHTFAAALRGAGLLDKGKSKDKDARMNDNSAGGVKRTAKVRPGTRMDIVKDPGSSSRSSPIAGKGRGPHSSIGVRGAAKLSLIGSSSKIPRRTVDAARRLQGFPLSSSVNSIDVWREFVQKRWKPEMQFLDLERVADDPIIKKITRLAKGFPDPKEAAVMFKIAGQLKPEVLALSLAHNGLTNTLPLQSLARYLPNLRNLSLASNKLRLWKDLDHLSLKKVKLLQLKELVLTGNPMREMDLSKLARYRNEILRRFPTLELLDSEVITKIAFNEPGPSNLPRPNPSQGPPSFPVDMNGGLVAPGVEGFVGEFLYRYFTAYDTSRATLGAVYAPSATFSFSANTSIPPRARVQRLHQNPNLPNQKLLEWTPYIHNGSRNLSRLHSNTRAQECLYIGPENIINKLTSMPATRHDIAAQEKFVVDAWPVQSVLPGPSDASTILFVSVHGQFQEEPSQGIRSFDRNFILAPAQPGSNTQAAGWQVVVLSDQLVIRAYSSHEAWVPGPIRMPPAESTNVAVSGPSQPQLSQQALSVQPPTTAIPPQQQQSLHDPALAQLTELQRSYVVELSMRTRLTVAYSIQCLEMNGWDPQRAVANFEEVRAQLPQDAFM